MRLSENSPICRDKSFHYEWCTIYMSVYVNKCFVKICTSYFQKNKNKNIKIYVHKYI